jgi:Na+/phosphate symporter
MAYINLKKLFYRLIFICIIFFIFYNKDLPHLGECLLCVGIVEELLLQLGGLDGQVGEALTQRALQEW